MKKNEPSVGIKKKDVLKSSKKEKKKAAPPEKFFREAGVLWIKLYGELLPEVDGEKANPFFFKDPVQMRNLKLILSALRERAEIKNVEWTKEECLCRLELFLRKAKEDNFIGSNFMLHIINSQKVKIFNNQITPKNGNKNQQGYSSGRSSLESPKPTIKPKGGFGRL